MAAAEQPNLTKLLGEYQELNERRTKTGDDIFDALGHYADLSYGFYVEGLASGVTVFQGVSRETGRPIFTRWPHRKPESITIPLALISRPKQNDIADIDPIIEAAVEMDPNDRSPESMSTWQPVRYDFALRNISVLRVLDGLDK